MDNQPDWETTYAMRFEVLDDGEIYIRLDDLLTALDAAAPLAAASGISAPRALYKLRWAIHAASHGEGLQPPYEYDR